MRYFFLLIFIHFQTHSIGQTKVDTVVFKKYSKEVILLSFPNYIKNNARFQLRDLQNEFNDQPSDIKLLFSNGYRNYKNGFTLQIVASSIMLASIAVLSKENRNVGYWGMIISVPINIIGVKLSIKGKRKIESAVWLRNRNILSY
ncbi:MAG: hypothetical protein SFU21_16305 [Flavihumibacter sp.]|nr:hypothetical protein [Flavihumibacter sp.]